MSTPALAFAQATNGVIIPLTGAQTLSYTGAVLNYVEVVVNGATYRQTLTYTGSNLTAVSGWELQ